MVRTDLVLGPLETWYFSVSWYLGSCDGSFFFKCQGTNRVTAETIAFKPKSKMNKMLNMKQEKLKLEPNKKTYPFCMVISCDDILCENKQQYCKQLYVSQFNRWIWFFRSCNLDGMVILAKRPPTEVSLHRIAPQLPMHHRTFHWIKLQHQMINQKELINRDSSTRTQARTFECGRFSKVEIDRITYSSHTHRVEGSFSV